MRRRGFVVGLGLMLVASFVVLATDIPQVASMVGLRSFAADISSSSSSSSSGPTGTIVVTVPAEGAAWKRGSTHTIKWTTSGDVGTNVTIDLLDNGNFTSVIANSVPASSDGHSWKIPKSGGTGDNYQVDVGSLSSEINGVSGYFCIYTKTSPCRK